MIRPLRALAAIPALLGASMLLASSAAFADGTVGTPDCTQYASCQSGTQSATVTIPPGNITVGSTNMTATGAIPNLFSGNTNGGVSGSPTLTDTSGAATGTLYIDDGTGLAQGWVLLMSAAPLTLNGVLPANRNNQNTLATVYFNGAVTELGSPLDQSQENAAGVHVVYPSAANALTIPLAGVMGQNIVSGDSTAMGAYSIPENLAWQVGAGNYSGTYSTTLFLTACELLPQPN